MCDDAEKGTETKEAESDEEVREATPLPIFGNAVAGLKAICPYM
jgi:hypothetical protein